MSKGSKAKYAAPEVVDTPADDGNLDSFEPDYADKCLSCDQSPTVTGVRHGRIVVQWHLCGPCCFGSARMLDPREWNE